MLITKHFVSPALARGGGETPPPYTLIRYAPVSLKRGSGSPVFCVGRIATCDACPPLEDSMTPMNTAEYRSYHGFQPRTDSKDCFHNPYLTPFMLHPETSQNRRALLVRGGRIGGFDPDALTCKLYHPLNLPEIHHIPPLKILSKSRLFPLGYAWGILFPTLPPKTPYKRFWSKLCDNCRHSMRSL